MTARHPLPDEPVQVVTIAATGGTFTLTYSGQETGPLAFDVSAADRAVRARGARADRRRQRRASSGPDGGPFELRFGGELTGKNVWVVEPDGEHARGVRRGHDAGAVALGVSARRRLRIGAKRVGRTSTQQRRGDHGRARGGTGRRGARCVRWRRRGAGDDMADAVDDRAAELTGARPARPRRTRTVADNRGRGGRGRGAPRGDRSRRGSRHAEEDPGVRCRTWRPRAGQARCDHAAAPPGRRPTRRRSRTGGGKRSCRRALSAAAGRGRRARAPRA